MSLHKEEILDEYFYRLQETLGALTRSQVLVGFMHLSVVYIVAIKMYCCNSLATNNITLRLQRRKLEMDV